jgi:hypothetical protein
MNLIRHFMLVAVFLVYAALAPGQAPPDATGSTATGGERPSDAAAEVAEVKAGRNFRPMLKEHHLAPLMLENEFVHGIGDADALQIKPTVERDHCWSWADVVLRNVELGTAWRTTEGAQKGLHVDRLQLLGNARQTAPLNVLFDRVRFTSRGDPMPPGATRADTCLLQEVWLGAVVFRDVRIERGLAPIKVTLRTPKSGVAGIVVDDSPDIRIHVTALEPAQVGIVFVRNSPGASITGADGLRLHIIQDRPDGPGLAAAAALAGNAAPALETLKRQLDKAYSDKARAAGAALSEIAKALQEIKGPQEPRATPLPER